MEKLTILIMTFIINSAYANQVDFLESLDLNLPISEKGYSLNVESLEKNMSLLDIELDQKYLFNYIRKTNPRVLASDAKKISHSILKVSKCFGLDPWFFTGLIQQESAFNKEAQSPTKATGLTQFTRIGIQEVNDQLGLQGSTAARPAAIAYFNNKIAECINPNWVQVWTQIEHDPSTPAFYEAVKARMKVDIDFAVTYGGILLKTYIAFIDARNTRNERGYEDYEILYHSLQMYNGEPGDAKVRYSKAVFNHVKKAYPGPISFPKVSY